MRVPFVDLKAQYLSIKNEIDSAIQNVINDTAFIKGKYVQKFEEEYAEIYGVNNVISCANGTDAIYITLKALGIGLGDEVITVANSWISTSETITQTGAQPVFVDIHPDYYTIDVNKIEENITPKTKAIIPVHLYGQCADMEAILKISREYNIPVIEDGAQAIGAECEIDGQKRSAGSSGEFGCFSFFPSKNLGGVGDGGIVTINNSEMADQLRLKRVHGGERKYYHRVIGGNFRLDPIQATVIRVKLPHLNKWHSQRQDNAEHYNKLFAEKDLGGKVQLPFVGHSENLQNPHIYNQYVIKAERRDELQAFLAENEIASEVYYPLPFHLQECFLHLGGKTGDFPVSEAAAEEVLALPVYPGMTKEMRETVVEQIANFYQS